MFVLKKQSNCCSVCFNVKRREKRPWLSVLQRKRWTFHLLPPAHPMSSCPDSVLERLVFSNNWLIFCLSVLINYELKPIIKKPRTWKKRTCPRKQLEFQNKWLIYRDTNTFAILCLSVAQCLYSLFTIIHFSDIFSVWTLW